MRKRRLPDVDECRAGIPVALDNADQHLAAADVLACSGRYGFAVAHLVFALEECEKARTMGKVATGVGVSEDELRSMLRDHRSRHVGAMGKSQTSAAVALFVQDLRTRGATEAVAGGGENSAEVRPLDTLEDHPQVLASDWPDEAGPLRERSLYVDVGDDGWTSPTDVTSVQFDDLRPAVVRQLGYVRAAYEVEVLGVRPSD